MHRTKILALLLAVSLLPVALLAAGTAHAADKATVTGEVIDSACYIEMGKRGPDHANCAESCAKSGVPLALLTDDGKVVWLVSAKHGENMNTVLMPYVAKKVSLEGSWYERGGTKLFSVSKVSPAS